jgi:drug/metabolite transporter (DMT)-like permease
MATDDRRRGFVALAVTVVCFGTLWTTAKLSIEHIPPLWFTALRYGIGGLFIATVLGPQRRLRLPDRRDIPIILTVGGVMLGLYAVIFQTALQFVHAGRATLLGYTTAIFVTPVAVLFLSEKLPPLKLFGLIAGSVGLLILFIPAEFDWTDRDVLIGNGMLLLCVLMWSAVIVHLRMHPNVTDTLGLVPWYMVVSGTVALVSALIFEGLPDFDLTWAAVGILAYAGMVGTGIGNWGVTTTLMYLPATTSTVGLLGVPVVALILSVLFLGEELTVSLGAGLVLIIGGIAAVTLSRA